MKSFNQELIALLMPQGYKVTQPRLAVFNFLKNNHKPASAKKIYQATGRKHDLVSIYRVLDLFTQLEIVFAEEIGQEKNYYISNHQHHHIVCRKCKKMECVPCYHHYESIKKFKNITHQVLLSGICNNCV